MKTNLLRLLGGMASFALAASVHAQTAWPTPVDTNANGKIDSAEIQAVITAITSGIVFLPASNTYNIDAPVTITKDNVTLLGEGHGVSSAGGTIFAITANIEGLVISNCTGSGARDMSIVAPAATHTTNAIRLQSATSATLTNLRVTNAYNGIEILNCSAPAIVDVSMRAHTGPYGLKIWGNGGTTSNVQITRITGAGVSGNSTTEWMIVGPNVNTLTLQSSRFVGAYRGMRLTGTPGPTNITTFRYGTDNQIGESLVAESGSGLTMINSWIGQPNGAGVILESGFGGTANFTNLRIRGAYQHGLQIDGGDDINIWNPLIGANGTDPSAGTTTISGVQIATGVTDVRIVGGRVGPLYSQGGAAKQYYGVRYLGTTTQSDTDNVKTRGPSLDGNGVPFTPSNLPTNN
ncbi:hypothetical protein [Oleiharenicola lentus]|uniref:hypothetical protein n=1 Tax=Oleiharenicola lentus TaxID=2508720 RepID=UPI003F67C8F5